MTSLVLNQPASSEKNIRLADIDSLNHDALSPAFSNMLRHNKWTYLVANTISFSNKLPQAIKMNRPDDDTLYIWLDKIVLGGQCSVLFVESLNMDDLRAQRLKLLCENMQVTLVNLTLDRNMPHNLVEGPWN